MANELSRNNWNDGVIAEFRQNHGKVGGYFARSTLLLLHTVGRKSGKPHVNPLGYLKEGERYMIFGSKAGADTHPDWYYNLKANPCVEVEIGDETLRMHAEEVTGPERDEIYARQAKEIPSFAEYAEKTKRVIPVIALTPETKRK